MMNMKKLLALLLAIVMVMGMFPMGVLADETNPSVPETTEVVVETTEGAALLELDPCENCDDETCPGCEGDVEPQNKDDEEKKDPVCTGDPTTCTIENCECKEPKTPVCTGDPATCTIEDCTCRQSQEPETLCDKCNATKDENGNIVHGEDCETLKPEVCEYCGIELTEDAEHAADCLSKCTCDPVDGVHQEGCVFAPVIIPGEECAPGSFVKPITFTDAAAPLEIAPPARTWGFFSTRGSEKVSHEKLHTYKTATTDANGNITLTLEAFLEGDPTKKERIPSDIVLVVDQSTSMCYCMDCGQDPDLRAQVNHHQAYYVDKDGDNNTKDDRVAVYYCPGTRTAGYESYKCGHSQGGWFENVHTSTTSTQGRRYVPSIANGAAYKLQSGTNKNYNVYTRVFYKTKNEDNTLSGRVEILRASSSAVRYHEGEVKLYNTSSGEYSTAPKLYRLNGKNFIELAYCSKHAAWHDTGVTCDTSNNANTGVYFYVPTATLDEVTLGTTRIFNVNSSSKPCIHETTRYQALMSALETFTESIYTYSTTYGVKNRIAVAGFGTTAYCQLLSVQGSGTQVAPVARSALSAANYKKSLHDVSTAEGQALINNAIDRISDQGGGTSTAYGLEIGRGVLENNDPLLSGETKRNRIVILFTDGQPQQDVTGDNYGGADSALKETYKIKTGLSNGNATVYTVGIFSGANGNDLNCVTRDTVAASSTGYITEAGSSNKLMHLLSSNYKGTSQPTMANNYQTTDFRTGYYLSAANPQDLVEAFRKIAESINNGSAVDIGDDSVVMDIITPYFEVSSDRDISWHTELCTGKDVKGNYTFVNDTSNDTKADKEKAETGIHTIPGSAENTVEVSGFNFKEYYVAIDDVYGTPTPRGRKLVIKIPIEPNPDFLGGDYVPTNGVASGVYTKEGNPIEHFAEEPTVDVPVKMIKPEFTNGAIYISQEAEIPHVTNIGEFTQAGESWTVDGINNAYVDIVYTIKNGNKTISYTIPAGTAFDEMLDVNDQDNWDETNGGLNLKQVLTENTTYNVACTVTSTGNEANTQPYAEDKTIYVFTPEITFQDSCMNLGQTANFDATGVNNGVTQNFVSIEWKNDAVTFASMADKLGTAPTLRYTYNPAEGAFTKDTPVQVTAVTSPATTTTYQLTHNVPANMDIMQYTTFYREGCEFTGCDMLNKEKTDVNATGTSWTNFIVHLNTFDIKIEKTGWNSLEPGQSYIFNVVGPTGSNIDLDVMINQNGHVILKGVPVGTYTIKEDTSWSWRYTPKDGAVKTVSATSAENGMATVKFENERKNPYWLDGNAYVSNVFGIAN